MTPKTQDLKDLDQALSSKGDPYETLAEHMGPAVHEYRRQWALAGQGELLPDFPLHLNIEIVYGCNLRCEFCAHSRPDRNIKNQTCRGKRLSFDQYKRIIDEGRERGLRSVALNGFNEPLLQKDIADYIRYAADAGILEVSLHTNAVLLTEEMSRSLLDSGLNIIMFSIDAFSCETYDQIRKGGDYDTVVQNILRFLELKKRSQQTLPLTRASFVMTRINAHEIDDFVAFWDEHTDYVMLQGFCNTFIDEPGYDDIEDRYRLEDQPFETCHLPWQRLSIAADGAVLPCCGYFGLEMPLGNIDDNSLHDLWHGPQMQQLRRIVNAADCPSSCRKCRRSAVGRDYRPTQP